MKQELKQCQVSDSNSQAVNEHELFFEELILKCGMVLYDVLRGRT